MRSPSTVTAFQIFWLFVSLAVIQVSSYECENVDDIKRYWDEEDGECKQCNRCNAGFGLDKVCGNGKGGDATCIPCGVEYFSETFDSETCKKCQICENVVSVLQECTARYDRACGPCKPGYYKHLHGTCEPCQNAQDECKDQVTEPTYNVTLAKPKRIPVIVDSSDNNNENSTGTDADGLLIAAIVLPIIATLLIVLLLGIIIYINKSRKKNQKKTKANEMKKQKTHGRHNSSGDENDAYQETPDSSRKTGDRGLEHERLIQGDVESDNGNEEMIPPVEEQTIALVQESDDQLQNQPTFEVVSEGQSTNIVNASPSDNPTPLPPEPYQQGQPGGAVTLADVHKPNVPPEQPKTEDEALKCREKALKLGKGKSLSSDLPYHVSDDICKRLKESDNFRLLASYVGMRPFEVKALDNPEDVMKYMANSMTGQRDVARLIKELERIPRYDIIDDVLVKWLFEIYGEPGGSSDDDNDDKPPRNVDDNKQ